MKKSSFVLFIILTAAIALSVGAVAGYFLSGTSRQNPQSDNNSSDAPSTVYEDEDISISESVIVLKTQNDNPSETELDMIESVLRTRLDSHGYYEATISRENPNKFKIHIPVFSVPTEIIDSLIAKPSLKFTDLDGNVLLTGADVMNAQAKYEAVDEMGTMSHFIELEFTQEGTEKFASATAYVAQLPAGQNVISITIDDTVISAPTVANEINSDICTIHGDFTAEDAKNFASQITAGNSAFELTIWEITFRRVGK